MRERRRRSVQRLLPLSDLCGGARRRLRRRLVGGLQLGRALLREAQLLDQRQRQRRRRGRDGGGRGREGVVGAVCGAADASANADADSRHAHAPEGPPVPAEASAAAEGRDGAAEERRGQRAGR